jgi:hypothetical protein
MLLGVEGARGGAAANEGGKGNTSTVKGFGEEGKQNRLGGQGAASWVVFFGLREGGGELGSEI